jgi:hypothetical protein
MSLSFTALVTASNSTGLINYLIPTDATLEIDIDVLDETVALDRALFAVEPAKQLRLISGRLQRQSLR